MTFFAIETIDSGVVAYSDGKPTVSRKFMCYDDAATLTFGTLYNYVRYSALPCGGEGGLTPPNCIGGLGGVDASTGLPMRSFDIQPVAERPGTFELTCNFTTGSSEADENEGEPGFQEFSMTVGRTFVDGWRGSPDYPPTGTPGDGDIGGQKLDSQGEPVSVPVLTQELSMGLVIPGWQLSSYLGTWRALANTRNSGEYLGASAGTLLFPGASVDRIGPDLYRASIVLYWDEFLHCRQVPVREADGSPEIDDKKAKTVMWRQPFPALANFSGLGVGLP